MRLNQHSSGNLSISKVNQPRLNVQLNENSINSMKGINFVYAVILLHEFNPSVCTVAFSFALGNEFQYKSNCRILSKVRTIWLGC